MHSLFLPDIYFGRKGDDLALLSGVVVLICFVGLLAVVLNFPSGRGLSGPFSCRPKADGELVWWGEM